MIVELQGGLLIQDEAVGLALELESRGHVLSATDGDLFVSLPSGLTQDDRAAIRRWKWHLLAIAAYQAP